ncbi:MAG: IPT/TIG domain-containing protein, partial [bacterium]
MNQDNIDKPSLRGAAEAISGVRSLPARGLPRVLRTLACLTGRQAMPLCLIFAFAFLMLPQTEADTIIYPAYDGADYYFEDGPRPLSPKSTATYESIVFPGKAVVMDGTPGANLQSHSVGVLPLKYDCLGIFVSHPLDGGQTITTAMTWTFYGSFAIQNYGTTGAPIVGHKVNALLYLWKGSWDDDHYMGTGASRDANWIILNNPLSGEHTAGKTVTTPWQGNIIAMSGATDGMAGNLTVEQGDRLVLEVQNYTTQAGAPGAAYFKFYAVSPDNSSLSWDTQELYFAPYIYKLADASGNKITETVGGTPGSPVLMRIYGGMFHGSTSGSKIQFEGWPNVTVSTSIWRNSLIQFEVPDITGTVKVSVYVNAEATSSQQISLRFLPQISGYTLADPDAVAISTSSLGQNWHYDDTTSTFTMKVYGHGFAPECTLVRDGGGLTVSSYNYTECPSTLTLTVSVGLNAQTDAQDIYIKNPDGGICPEGYGETFNISARPKIDYFEPQAVAAGLSCAWSTITLSGNDYTAGVEAKFYIPGESCGGVNVMGKNVINAGSMEFYVNVMASATVSKNWRLILTTPDKGYTDSVIDAGIKFSVEKQLKLSVLNIVGSKPTNHLGQNAENRTVRIYGDGFEANNVDVWFGADVAGDSITVNSVNTYGVYVDADVTVSSNCPTGDWDIHVLNEGNGGYVCWTGSMTVNPMPTISTITAPTFKQLGERAEVAFAATGTNFVKDSMKMEFSQGVVVLPATEIKATSISTSGPMAVSANITVYEDCTKGYVDFVIINKDQGRSNKVMNAFKINPMPSFDSIGPGSVGQGVSNLPVIIFGGGFQDNCSVDFGDLITSHIDSVGTSSITLTIDSVGDYALIGKRNVTVTNPDGGYDTLESSFTVNSKPEVDELLPSPCIKALGVKGSTLTVVGKGAYFQQGLEVWFSTSGVTGYEKATKISWASTYASGYPASILELRDITISTETAIIGDYYIVTQNPDNGFSISTVKVLEIVALPTLDAELVVSGSAITNQLGKGCSEKTLKIYGSGFETGISDENISFGIRSSSITIESVSWKASSRIEVMVSIATNCLIGGCSVQITNPVSGGKVTNATTNFFVIGDMPVISTITLPFVKEYGQTAYTAGNSSKTFKLLGSNFHQEMQVWFGNNQMTPLDIKPLYNGATWYQCDFNISASFIPGTYNVTVINPDLGECTFGTIKINKKPSFTSLSNDESGQGQTVQELIVTCGFLQEGCEIYMGDDIEYSNYNYSGVSYGTFTLTIVVSPTALQNARDVVITNPDLGYATDPSGFTVVYAPKVNSISPNQRARSVETSSMTVIGVGPYFATNVEVWFSTTSSGEPPDPQIDTGTLNAATFETSMFTLNNVIVSSYAALGDRWIKTLNPTSGVYGVSTLKVLVIEGEMTLDAAPAGLTAVGSNPTNQLGKNTSEKTLRITGTNFENGLTEESVDFGIHGDSITIESVSWISSKKMEVMVNISTHCLASGCTVTITNPDNGSVKTSQTTNYFVITECPVISTVTSPTVKEYGQTSATSDYPEKKLKLQGSYFDSSLGLYIGGEEITISNQWLSVDATEFWCDLVIPETFATGTQDVQVINPDQGQWTLTNTIKINPKPTFTSLSPTSVGQGMQNATFTVTGANISTGCVIEFGVGFSTVSYTYYGETASSFTVVVNVTEAAQTGFRNVTIRNPDLGYATKSNAVNVVPKPEVNSISPTKRAQGVMGTTITVIGSNFQNDPDVPDVWFSTSSTGYPKDDATGGPSGYVIVTAGGVEYENSSTLYLKTVNVSTDAATGGRYLFIRNPDGGESVSNTPLLTIDAAMTLAAGGLTVSGASPSNQLGKNSEEKTLVILGNNFESGITGDYVSFDIRDSSITIESVSWISKSKLQVMVTVSSHCLAGGCTVQITNPQNGSFVMSDTTYYFIIGECPVISTVTSPVVKEYGRAANTSNYPSKKLKLQGQDLNKNLDLYFGVNEITVSNPYLSPSATEFWCNVMISESYSPLGVQNIQVINPDLGQWTLEDAITINDKPTFDEISPATAGQGTQGAVYTVTGSNIKDGCTIDFGLGFSTVSYVYDVDTPSFTVTVNISETAQSGYRSATIRNLDLGYDTKANAIEVVPKPEVDSILPNERAQGVSGTTITVIGAYFQNTPDVPEVWFSTSSTGYPEDDETGGPAGYVTVGWVEYQDASTLYLKNVEVSTDATPGGRYIAVKNADGGMSVSNTALFTADAAMTLDAGGLTVIGADPSNQLGKNSMEKTLRILGSNFESGITANDVTFDIRDSSITIESVSWKSPSRIEVMVNVSSHCLTGGCTVQITNPENASVAMSDTTYYFVIGECPVISTVTSPVVKEYGRTANTRDYPAKKLKLSGSGFNISLGVYIGGEEITISNQELKGNATGFWCDLIISETFGLGTQNLQVINPDLGQWTVTGGITINKAPAFSAITPDMVGQGTQGAVFTITGSEIKDGCTIDFGEVGISTVSFNYDQDNSSFSVTVNVGGSVQAGYKDATIRNPDLGYDIKSSALQVVPKPEVDSISPNERAQGVSGSTLALIGSNFQNTPDVPEVWFSTSSTGYPEDDGTGGPAGYVTVGSVEYENSSSLSLKNVNVSTDAATGGRYVVVVNADGGMSVSNTALLTIDAAMTLTPVGLTVTGAGTGYEKQLGQNASEKTLSILGSNFESGITGNYVSFDIRDSSITIESVNWKSSGKIEVMVSVSTHCLTGSCTVQITNPENGSIASSNTTDYFIIGLAPVISTVSSPSPREYGQRAATAGNADKKFHISMSSPAAGEYLSGLDLYFGGTEMSYTNSSLSADGTSFWCDLTISETFATGWQDVKVVNPDQGEWTLTNGIYINPKPVITTLAHSSGKDTIGQGCTGATVTVTGTGLQDEIGINFGLGVSTSN